MLALLQYDFIRYAIFTGILIGFVVPLIGVFVVVRKQALIADALSHVTLSGIAFGMLLQKTNPAFAVVSPVIWGMSASGIGAIAIEKLRQSYRHYQELAIPIIMSSGIGLSVIFIGLAEGFTTDLFGYLFGSVSAVTQSDAILMVIVSVITVSLLTYYYRTLFALSFDEEYAIVSGVRSKFLNYLFILLVAMVVSVAMKVVGILLVSSLMTLPVAASMRLGKGFIGTIGWSIFFGEVSMIVGLWLAFVFDLSPGGVIVMVSVLILVLTIAFTNAKKGK
ncbi:MAG: metal ABC transporter permease [Bacilli bacterium]